MSKALVCFSCFFFSYYIEGGCILQYFFFIRSGSVKIMPFFTPFTVSRSKCIPDHLPWGHFVLYVSEFWNIFRNPGSGTCDFTGFL